MQRLALLLAAALLAGPAVAQDAALRPTARPVIVPEYADVRPVARDVSEVEAPDRDASETAAVSQSASPLTTDAAVEPATVAEEPSAPTGPSAIIAFG